MSSRQAIAAAAALAGLEGGLEWAVMTTKRNGASLIGFTAIFLRTGTASFAKRVLT